MKQKKLLILEQVKTELKQITEGNSDVIYLEGIFTEFNVRNRNNRIYEASDFIPKMEELRPRIENHTLLGELDHPSTFDVSLKNASHVIESLTYDRENNRVVGKIRLLNTKAGKDAQALVRDGIPLHISSRAAGSIDANGRVTLEKLFTYDLVAEPGFENAELVRVNESYTFGGGSNFEETCLNEQFGIISDDVKIYECEIEEEINDKNMNNTENVTLKDFQKYTQYVAGVLENVKTELGELKKQVSVTESANPVDNKKIVKLTKYVDYLAEELEKTQNHSDYLAEQLQRNCDHNDYLAEELEKTQVHSDYLAEQVEKSITYGEYLAENINNNIAYSTYLGEKLDQNYAHNDYLAEQLQKNCDHNDYLAEQLQRNCDHNDYLAEQLQRNCDHNDYLAEKLEQNFAHNDYLAEKLEQNFAHNDYLAEKLNQNYAHNDYLAEQIEQTYANKVNESVKTKSVKAQQINEGVETKTVRSESTNEEYMSGITNKLDALFNQIDEKVSETNFMNLLSESRQNEFSMLDADMQKTITDAMNVANVKNEAQANVVWKAVYESKKGLDIVENMPEVYKEKWNALSQDRKDEILNESKFYNLKSQNEIDYFWTTRDLREKQIVCEKVNTDTAKMWEQNTAEQDNHIGNILSRTMKNMRGF